MPAEFLKLLVMQINRGSLSEKVPVERSRKGQILNALVQPHPNLRSVRAAFKSISATEAASVMLHAPRISHQPGFT